MAIQCDICAKEIKDLVLGMCSWQEEEGQLSNFCVHHKHTCVVSENNSWIPLYLLYNPKIFINWLMLFTRKWSRGNRLKDRKKLEQIVIKLSAHNLRELDEKENRDWIGYTNRILPLKFPDEE